MTPTDAAAPWWNRNIEYHRVLFDALGDPCGSVLDVGCGHGGLTLDLADRAAQVLAVDADEACVRVTQERLAGREHVEVRRLDVMAEDLPPASFDAVVGVAVLHHLGPVRPALERLSALVAPGGTLALVGLARSRTGYDLAHDAVGAVLSGWLAWRRGGQLAVTAPIQDPRDTYTDVLRTATLLLPDVRYRRHAMFRWSLVWVRPDDWEPPGPT